MTAWTLGQIVDVRPRTWAGINRPGGNGRITKIHRNAQGCVTSLDVKYTIASGGDTNLDVSLVQPHQELDRGSRKRRTRDTANQAGQENAPENANRRKVVSKATKPRPSVQQRKRPKAEKPKSRPPKESKSSRTQKPVASVPQSISFCSATPSREASEAMKVSPLPVVEGPEAQPQRSYMLPASQRLPKQAKPLPILSPSFLDDCSMKARPSDPPPPPRNLKGTTASTKPADIAPTRKVQRAAAFSKSLRAVYDENVQDASRFVAEVVRAEPAPPPIPVVDPVRAARQGRFVTALMALLQTLEMVDRNEIMQELKGYHEKTSPVDYSPNEVKEFVDELVTDSKIMESDGQLYLI